MRLVRLATATLVALALSACSTSWGQFGSQAARQIGNDAKQIPGAAAGIGKDAYGVATEGPAR